MIVACSTFRRSIDLRFSFKFTCTQMRRSVVYFRKILSRKEHLVVHLSGAAVDVVCRAC